MTAKELLNEIRITAESAREAGQYVEFNYRLPYVLVHRGDDDEYFFQGDEASRLLDEIDKLRNVVDLEILDMDDVGISDGDLLLWLAQGW
jgi:hypothetical protein